MSRAQANTQLQRIVGRVPDGWRMPALLLLLAIAPGNLAGQTPSPAYRPTMPSCFQPVEFIGPPGTQLSVAAQGAFLEPRPLPQVVSLLIGPLYRLRITGLAGEEGREVFPSVELLDRMCPPPGQELRFPVPIELTEDDLRLALSGHFVTRVIYVEDPSLALQAVGDPDHPSWFDIGPGLDPLKEAKHHGRPIAILRLGGRLPDDSRGPDMQFLAGCPPLVLHGPPRRPAVAAVQPPRAAASQPSNANGGAP
jgi:hypothetical protein